ncbi:class I SAM-dependent methyltransferase [Halorubellus litoreus]|uniref:Class I SAM-dependent methyltransferase n=1 Tax=Halorubellus litoreus TaxID=755308 RepID=A0ABD5VHL2_9EURY
MTRDDDSVGDDALAQRTAVRRGYDDLADAYAAERDDANYDVLLDRFLADAPAGPVLDVGCGAGQPVLSDLAADRPVVGLDFSREQLSRADDVAPGRVVQGDMTSLPFADDAFAALTAFCSVIHVPFDQHADVYAEFERVLEPGGELLVTVGADDWSGRNDDWLDSGTPMEWSHYGLEKSRELIEDAGFTVTDAVGILGAGLGDDRATEPRLVEPDADGAGHPFCFARLRE